MKFKNISPVLMLGISTLITPQKASAQVSVSFQVFYDELSPYGTWVDNSDYGYVWIPNVAPGFTPYGTNGYWVFTDEGWTWVSNYSWGWAPFHYGRWYTDAIYGPIWVPDNEWGPGWVTWRRSDDYYGWAPIGPGVSISLAYSDGYNIPHHHWTFIRNRDFGGRDINNHYVNSSNNVTIINNTTVINNTRVDKTRNVTYNQGPDRMEVEKRAGKSIAPIAIRESNKPGQNMDKDQLQLYKPQVQKNNTAERKSAPSKVEALKDVKPAAQRNTESPSQKQNQLNKEEPSNQQRNNKQNKEQPTQKQRNNQPNKEQQIQPQGTDQPAKQEPSNQQRNNKRNKEQPVQQQPNNQPNKHKQPQKQREVQPTKQQPSQPRQNNPQQNNRREKKPH